MMAAPRRRALADLATIPTMDAPVPFIGPAPARQIAVPLALVAPNPLNPPTRIDYLEDLATMETMGQLQACVVVTRTVFLALHPEHEATIGGAEFVIVAGSRRRAAAEKFRLATLDVVIKDDLAGNQLDFYGVLMAENLNRKALTPLEEAEGFRHMISLGATGAQVAKKVGVSEGLVSQRLTLLNLTPELKEHLSSGALKVGQARELGKLPVEEQEAGWRKMTAPPEPEQRTVSTPRPAQPAARPASTPAPVDHSAAAHPTPSLVIRIPLGASPAEVVALLRGLPPETLGAVASLLAGLPA